MPRKITPPLECFANAFVNIFDLGLVFVQREILEKCLNCSRAHTFTNKTIITNNIALSPRLETCQSPKGVVNVSAELKYRLSCLQSPCALAELVGNYLTVAFISNIVHTIRDLFHVSLARKKEWFLRLKGSKIHQQEFLRFHISRPVWNDFFLI